MGNNLYLKKKIKKKLEHCTNGAAKINFFKKFKYCKSKYIRLEKHKAPELPYYWVFVVKSC